MASKYLIYKNRKNEFKKLLDRAVKLDIVSAFVSRNDIFNDTIERAKDGKLTVRLLAGNISENKKMGFSTQKSIYSLITLVKKEFL